MSRSLHISKASLRNCRAYDGTAMPSELATPSINFKRSLNNSTSCLLRSSTSPEMTQIALVLQPNGGLTPLGEPGNHKPLQPVNTLLLFLRALHVAVRAEPQSHSMLCCRWDHITCVWCCRWDCVTCVCCCKCDRVTCVCCCRWDCVTCVLF